MAGIKIVDLPALGRDLAATDLLELSLAGGTGSRKITGQEIMNASKLSVGNTPIINGAVGQVLFQGTGNVLQESANLFWDNTNGRLGIGTSSPIAPLQITTSGLVTALYVNTGNDGGFTAQNNGTLALNRTTQVRLVNGSTIFGANDRTYQLVNIGKGTTDADFYVQYWNGASYLERFRVFSTGNVSIGTTTDAGYKLDVNGTFRALVSTETNPFVIQHTNGNYATILIGNGSQLAAGQMGMYFNGSPIWTWNGSAFRLPGNIISTQNNPSTLLISGGWGGSTLGTSLRLSSNTGNQGVFTATSGTQSTVEIGNTSNETWSPSSGNATYNLLSVVPRINTTGTYSGIVRGLYYSPTLTSVTGVAHRAIETTAGDVLLGNGSLTISSSGPTFNMNVLNNSQISAIYMNATDGNPRGGLYTNISTGEVRLIAGTGGYFQTFYSNNAERVRITTSGNVLIGTTTDAGFRLDVNGTARVQGNVTVTGTLLYLSHTSIGLSGNVGTGILELFNSSGSAGNTRISLGGTTYLNIYQPISASSGITAGAINTITTPITYSWASGTASPNLFQLNPNYNFTGTYSGIARGFYYNPTLTSTTGLTHFAFHSTSGRVRFEGLPTSPTGLNAGDLWNDAGTLKIV